MLKPELSALIGQFARTYDSEAKDRIWHDQSQQFRDFWDKTILNGSSRIIPDTECDKIIRILDCNGKGNTKESEAVAKAMVAQGAWRRMLNEFHKNKNLSSLITDIFKVIDAEQKADLIDQLYKINEEKANYLTGRSGNAINAFLAAYDPFNNMSIISLKDRRAVIEFFNLPVPFSWDEASVGRRIVATNRIIFDGLHALGVVGSARTVSRFCYFPPVKALWKGEHTVKRTDKSIGVTVSKSTGADETEESDKEEVGATNKGRSQFPAQVSPQHARVKTNSGRERMKSRQSDETDIDTELDELLEDEATQEESVVDSSSDPGLERRKIFTDKSDPPISALHMRHNAGDLVLDPIFQRRKVWEDARSSRLIESLILEVPLPVFYFAEEMDGKEEVIDGQQRLNAFFRFLNNDYALSGLKAMPHLNGKYFRELDKPAQKLVRDSSVRTIIFKKESDENLRFEIFERLNTGAVPLNRQELRNCVYRGPYNELLIALAGDTDYMWLMGLKGPERRMRDVEYVLRFAAFHHATYLKYKPPIARFLDEDMRKYRVADSKEQDELSVAFKTAVTLVRSLLGEHAFRRFYRGDETSPEGRWEPKKFNASLFDILMCLFADKDKNQVMANLDAIRESLIALMTNNDAFIDAIELSTSAVRMVTARFDIWRQALDSVLIASPKQPRTFSRALKQKLYEQNRTCAICNQFISDIDDAAVDHIEQYWLGGRTIPENARLAHRYCNWSRARKEK